MKQNQAVIIFGSGCLDYSAIEAWSKEFVHGSSITQIV